MKIYDTLTKKMRPTQICVGYDEVSDKKAKISKLNKNQLQKYLKENPLPAVAGPDGRMYLTDHHHLGRALLELGIERSFFVVKHDFSAIPEKKFFDVLQVLELVHPFDENGIKKDYAQIPKLLTELKDDPYRSLAGFVRRAGGYRKVDIPYLEFQWADYFRPLIPKAQLKTKKGMKKAVVEAIAIAQADTAQHMLGWVGVTVKVENTVTLDNKVVKESIAEIKPAKVDKVDKLEKVIKTNDSKAPKIKS